MERKGRSTKNNHATTTTSTVTHITDSTPIISAFSGILTTSRDLKPAAVGGGQQDTENIDCCTFLSLRLRSTGRETAAAVVGVPEANDYQSRRRSRFFVADACSQKRERRWRRKSGFGLERFRRRGRGMLVVALVIGVAACSPCTEGWENGWKIFPLFLFLLSESFTKIALPCFHWKNWEKRIITYW